MSVNPLTLIHMEEGNLIVVVCLEHFIAAQGDNTVEALEAFWDVWSAQNMCSTKISEIMPAPQNYWDLISGKTSDGTFRVMDYPDSWDVTMYYLSPLKK